MNTGIYAITHIASGKRYVGSAISFQRRFLCHRSMLRRGVHHNRHLQSAWNRFGAEAFRFERLIVCAPTDLIFYEQRALDAFRAADARHGYNLRARAESQLGITPTAETRERISQALRGRPISYVRPPMSEETRNKIRETKSRQRRAECPKGHPLSGANLYLHPNSERRSCRACRCAVAVAHKKAKRAGGAS